uniref:Uncharacterized protein n=1 Tax=Cannabis sativa TaxID=3483 RepID=A0A803QCY4_CANSA
MITLGDQYDGLNQLLGLCNQEVTKLIAETSKLEKELAKEHKQKEEALDGRTNTTFLLYLPSFYAPLFVISVTWWPSSRWPCVTKSKSNSGQLPFASSRHFCKVSFSDGQGVQFPSNICGRGRGPKGRACGQGDVNPLYNACDWENIFVAMQARINEQDKEIRRLRQQGTPAVPTPKMQVALTPAVQVAPVAVLNRMEPL